jgi:hypothetical protein
VDGSGITSELILLLRKRVSPEKFVEVKQLILRFQARRKQQGAHTDTKVQLERELRALVTDNTFDACREETRRVKASRNARACDLIDKILAEDESGASAAAAAAAAADATAGLQPSVSAVSSTEATLREFTRLWRVATPLQHATDKKLQKLRELLLQRRDRPRFKALLALPSALITHISSAAAVPYSRGAVSLFTAARLEREDRHMLQPLPRRSLATSAAAASAAEGRAEAANPVAAWDDIVAKLRVACAAHFVALPGCDAAGGGGGGSGGVRCASMLQLAVEGHMRALLRALVRTAAHRTHTQSLVLGGGGGGGGSAAGIKVTSEPWRSHFMAAHAAHSALRAKRLRQIEAEHVQPGGGGGEGGGSGRGSSEAGAAAEREGGERKRSRVAVREAERVLEAEGGLPPVASEASFKQQPARHCVLAEDVLALVAPRARGVSGAAYVAAVNSRKR